MLDVHSVQAVLDFHRTIGGLWVALRIWWLAVDGHQACSSSEQLNHPSNFFSQGLCTVFIGLQLPK